jgi:triosephosphate isomerase
VRRPVIAGNWKMYKTQAEARAFFAAFKPLVARPRTARSSSRRRSRRWRRRWKAARHEYRIAAQDMYWAKRRRVHRRSFAPMLVEVGCRAVIIAHSERRQFFGETDETANRKVKAALAADLTPILCVGESLAEREAEQM